MKKENLAQWAFLALKKALTIYNIRVGFKACGIWPLNFDATKSKMEFSKGFHTHTSNDSQDAILVQEIWEEGFPSVQEEALYYFVDHESSGDDLP